MRTTHSKYSFTIVFILLTGAFLVSGCIDSTDENGTEMTEIKPEEIINIQWQWSEMTGNASDSQLTIPDPGNYILVFVPDGTYLIKADCNRGSGNYILEGNNLTLEPGPITLAYCGDQSLDDEYLSALGNVTSLDLESEQLILYTKNEEKMIFDNGGAFDDNL